MTDSTFSLPGLAAQIVRDSDSADPGDLAIELINSLPPEQHEDAVLTMAREYMRGVISSLRGAANGAQRQAVGSKKVAAARDAWQRLIDAPEYVPSLGAWVRLREATRSQVMEMAQHRMDQAHKNAAAARRYERIARSMQRLGSNTVGDLPADILVATFQPEDQEPAA